MAFPAYWNLVPNFGSPLICMGHVDDLSMHKLPQALCSYRTPHLYDMSVSKRGLDLERLYATKVLNPSSNHSLFLFLQFSKVRMQFV